MRLNLILQASFFVLLITLLATTQPFVIFGCVPALALLTYVLFLQFRNEISSSLSLFSFNNNHTHIDTMIDFRDNLLEATNNGINSRLSILLTELSNTA